MYFLLDQNHVYTDLPQRLFGTASQSFLRCCLTAAFILPQILTRNSHLHNILNSTSSSSPLSSCPHPEWGNTRARESRILLVFPDGGCPGDWGNSAGSGGLSPRHSPWTQPPSDRKLSSRLPVRAPAPRSPLPEPSPAHLLSSCSPPLCCRLIAPSRTRG